MKHKQCTPGLPHLLAGGEQLDGVLGKVLVVHLQYAARYATTICYKQRTLNIK